MKILVFSDSHGEKRKMLETARTVKPQMIIHLGDYIKDAAALKKSLPGTPLRCVRGNCDFSPAERESDMFFADDVKIMIAHGHRFGVKSGYEAIAKAALENNAGICLFGHTHRAMSRRLENGGLLLNPGAAESGSCAVIELGGGTWDFEFLDI